MNTEEQKIVAKYLGIRITNSWTTLFEPIINPDCDWQYKVNNTLHENMDDGSWYVTSLLFDESWDWLVCLVNKVMIDGLEETHGNLFSEIQRGFISVDIKRVYKACLEFINR